MKTLLLLLLVLSPTVSFAEEPIPPVQLLDFTASYCKPCQQMLPILKRMENDGFPIRQVDISEQPELSKKYSVQAVPTLILLVNGRETERFVGLTDEAVLRRVMNAAARQLAEQQRALNPPAAAPAPAVPPADSQVEKPDGGKSLGDLFGKMFPRWGRAQRDPIIRGQSPEVTAAPAGLTLAEAATVRVTVEGITEDDGNKVRETGTGTIIHSSADETVILTCSHFFQGLNVKSTRTFVEAFVAGQAQRLPAEVVLGNHRLDLAVLRIRPQQMLPAATLATAADTLVDAQELVSFGCDEGAQPSQLKVTLLDQNRYNGPGNLVCSKAPASGRSGGGLYDADGRLVGVCSCANRNQAEGLYMSRSAIDELLALDRLKWLRELLTVPQPEPKNLAEAVPATESGNEFHELLEEPFAGQSEGESEESGGFVSSVAEAGADADFPAAEPAAPAAAGPEVTVIIDDRQPGAQKKVIVIPRASPWLMEMLTGDKSEVSSEAVSPPQAVSPSQAVSPAIQAVSPAVRRTAAKKPAADVSAAVEAAYPR